MARLTVFFDDPWWVGVVEVEEAGTLRASRHVFGAEPGDEEVLEFLARRFLSILDRPDATGGVPVEAPPGGDAK